MDLMDICVPDLGDIQGAEVIELLVAPGDHIERDQSLVVVESDKASVEIPSVHKGVVKEVLVQVGDKISAGVALLKLAPATGVEAPQETARTQKLRHDDIDGGSTHDHRSDDARQVRGDTPPSQYSTHDRALVHASPSVRKFARELGVNLQVLHGTGPKGRIGHDDIRQFVKSVLRAKEPSGTGKVGSQLDILPWPSVDFEKFGPVETKLLTRIQKLSGPNLHRNWVMIPHVTQYDEVDVTELEEFRRRINSSGDIDTRLTLLAFAMKACAVALKEFPLFNSSLNHDGQSVVLKHYYHLGFAADTPGGLVVPVVKNVDRKGVAQIATELSRLSDQARQGKLKPADMQGATFTISSLGGIGGQGFTPIINAPEVAILGMAKAQLKPVWNGTAFVPRLAMPISLSYDHRVIDGAMGARFIVYLGKLLEDMRRTLL